MVFVPAKITRVVPDDPLIKVFGVRDDCQIELIDRILENYNAKLEKGDGRLRSASDVAPGETVLVPLFGKYKRAKILDSEDGRGTIVQVQFLDIGGTGYYELHELRLINAVPELRFIVLPDSPPCGYILDAVLKVKEWPVDELQTMNAICRLTKENIKCDIDSVVDGYPLVNVQFSNGRQAMSFAGFLINRGYVSSATLDQMKVAISIKENPAAAVSRPLSISPPAFADSNNYRVPTSSSNITPHSQMDRVNHVPTPRTIPLAPTFAVGLQCEVYVTNTISGMQSFIVQVKSNVDNMLSPFMTALNNAAPEPFTDPLLPCTFCLGRYSGDNSLCRAVVTTVMADRAILIFVDYGTIESVPLNEIYKIPPQFTHSPMFASRFSLTGCKDHPLLASKEADKLFSDFIMNSGDTFYLKVMKPEAHPRQYCELYFKKDDKMVNIKDEILSRLKPPQVSQYKRIPFKKNSQADVTVSLVSGVRFFVQWSLNEDQLTNIMNVVEHYCATDAPLVSEVTKNMPVCSLYLGDQKWYRAIVTSDINPAGMVEVLLVDYGNKELVHVSNLRIASDKIISLGPIQAVECQLNLDAEVSSREDVAANFSEIVAANEYRMRVLNVLSDDVFLVDLFDKTTQQNVKDILLQRFQVTPESTYGSNDGLTDDNLRPMNDSLQTSNLRDRGLITVVVNDENLTLEKPVMNNDLVANEHMEESQSRSYNRVPIKRFTWSEEPRPKSDDVWEGFDLGTWSSQDELIPSCLTGASPKSDQSTEPLRKLETLSMTEILERDIEAKKVNPSSDTWQKPKPPSLPNGRGAQFVEPDFKPGQQLEVIITFFANPSLFHVIPIPDDDFRAMTDSFQDDYSRCEPVNVNSLKHNDCIIARDKSDALYRARFLHGRPHGAMVSFVDFGISSVVGKGQIWAIKQEHCQIPVQAVSCKLHDVETIDENTPWSALEGVSDFFDGGAYTLTFKECINLKGSVTWAVDLTNEENADVGSLLVKKGLAVRRKVPENDKLSNSSLSENGPVPASPDNAISSDELNTDAT